MSEVAPAPAPPLPEIKANPTRGLGDLVVQNAEDAQRFVSMVIAQAMNGVLLAWPGAFEHAGPAYVNAGLYEKGALEVQVTAHITAKIDGRDVRIQVEVP
jgi:hypothetical protein